jgi:hypothetical protein
MISVNDDTRCTGAAEQQGRTAAHVGLPDVIIHAFEKPQAWEVTRVITRRGYSQALDPLVLSILLLG